MSRKTSLRSALMRGVFPHQASWLLELPLRRLLISPQQLADRIPLSPSSRILELGPGSGFFSAELASRVPRGRLELFDLQPEMLQKARRRLPHATNVGYTTGDASSRLPYAAATFDIVVMVAVLGEVPDAQSCLRHVRELLRPSGYLVCHESLPDPDRIRYDRLVELARASGFEPKRRWGRTWNYTAVFAVV